MTLSFTAKTEDFANTIAAAANALPARAQQDIYHRMLLSADEDLRILASDGEMRLEARGECSTEDKGSCTIPGKLLSDISKYFSADEVHVRHEGSELLITSGRSKFSIAAGDGDEYPVWEMPAPPFLRVSGEELAAAFRAAVPAAGEHPPCLTAICLEAALRLPSGNGVLNLVTTDRNRMAVVTLECESQDEITSRALLPAGAATRLARVLPPAGGEASIGWNEGILSVTYGKGEMMTRLIAEPYPGWRRILDKEPGHPGITCDTKEMTRAVRMAQLAAGQDNKISWAFGKDEIAVRADREGRECTEYVPCSYEGEPVTFLLDARYILDGLAGMGETAELRFTQPENPLFLRSGNFRYSVQPRREL
mgnify:CR=1 FL=1